MPTIIEDYKGQYFVSVVIPTLGGETLKKTIESLNSGIIIPKEILICIPEEHASDIEKFSYENVQVIKTKCRGQVVQRIEGFKKSSCDYVIQLDDDIIVDKHCISSMIKVFDTHESNNIAVAPSLINISTGESVYKKPDKNRLIASLYYWLMNGSLGYQPGKIDKTGTPVGFDIKNEEVSILESDWLAGGCIMHHRDNLVLDNYFPFNGKAFGEDVMHSLILKDRDTKLYIQPKSKCYLELDPMTAPIFSDFLINLKSEIKIRKHYMGLISGRTIRIDIYYIITVIRFLYKKLIISLKT